MVMLHRLPRSLFSFRPLCCKCWPLLAGLLLGFGLLSPATAQDRVLEATLNAARLSRPILFHAAGGVHLYDPAQGESRLAFAAGSGACLSHNEKLIAASSYAGDQRRIWISEIGGKPEPITEDHTPDQLQEIAFSPDDRYIAYQVRGHTVGEDFTYVIDLQQRQRWQATPEGMTSQYFSWSPDGSQLALGLVFETESEVFGDQLIVKRKMDIAILDVATSEFRRVTYQGEELQELSWSPDGKWIAYKSVKGLFVVSAEQSEKTGAGEEPVEPRLLQEWVSGEGAPRWSPDSKAIAVARHARRDSDTQEQIFVVPLDGDPRSYEFEHQIWYYDFGPAGDSLAVATDDRTLTQLNLKTDQRSELVSEVGFWSHVTWANQR